MGVAPRIPGGGTGKLTKLKSTSFSLSGGTSTTVTIDLSSYPVGNKKTEDFVLGIESLTASTSYSESRKVSSIAITEFSNNELTVVAQHEPYDYHAQNITFGVAVYCVM